MALREALINALSHRQWEKYNLTISLAIYDDRIEIANPGVLPNQLTVDTLKQSHESFPYNENVAKVLYHSTYLERWGSGVKRIVDACVEQGLPEPVWRANAGFITVTFQRPSHASAGSGQAENKTQADTTQKSGVPVLPQYYPSCTPVVPQYYPS